MKRVLLLVMFVSAMTVAGVGFASGNHAHSHDDEGQGMGTHGHDSKDVVHEDKGPAMFLEKRSVDGYEVSFHVMKAKEGMGHGGSHNFMIKVEEGGKALQNLTINSKVVHPNGDAETKALSKMGEWFMNGYDLGHSGRHQLMILFKTADGKKHKAGVYYNN